MSGWDRIQRLEIEMAQLRARLLRMDNLNLLLKDELAQALRERDTARSIAMRLEEETHMLWGGKKPDIVMVPLVGEAT